jgi:hypothetical protein
MLHCISLTDTCERCNDPGAHESRQFLDHKIDYQQHITWKLLSSIRGRITPKETAYGTHWLVGWVGSRARLEVTEWNGVCCLYWESNHRNSTRSRRYTDWDIPTLRIRYVCFERKRSITNRSTKKCEKMVQSNNIESEKCDKGIIRDICW